MCIKRNLYCSKMYCAARLSNHFKNVHNSCEKIIHYYAEFITAISNTAHLKKKKNIERLVNK